MKPIPLQSEKRSTHRPLALTLMPTAALLATLAIVDTAPAQTTVTVSATHSISAELRNPDGTTNTGVFEITRSGNLSSNLQIFVTLSGTAIYGIDYVTSPRLEFLAISQGHSSTNMLVIPLDDNLAETNQTVILTIVTNRYYSAYNIGQPASATVTILEDSDTNRPPSVWLTYPPPGARFVTGNNVLLGADVFDPDANAQTVEFLLDGTSAGIVNLASITNYEAYLLTNFTQFASLLAPELSPGAHLLTARATDLFGAQATASQSFTVLPPAMPPPNSPALAAEPSSPSSYALDASGALYIWGAFTAPSQVPIPADATAWTQVSGGQSSSLAIANNGQLYSWGANYCGQLGIGSAPVEFVSFPVPVQAPAAVTGWKKAASGACFSVGIDNTGRLYAWGNNFVGQLGIGSTIYQYYPVPVAFPAGVSNWVDVAARNLTTLVLADSGVLYACGAGPLGNNSVSNDVPDGVSHLIPVIFPRGVTRWTQIAAGGVHSLAFGNDGNLYSWGENYNGNVLPGSTTFDILTPVLVPPRTAPWSAVAGGGYDTLGLARDGNLFQWGMDPYGDSPSITNGPPIQVPPGATRWLSIASAYDHKLAIADDCKVYAWGDGSTSNSLVPIPALLPANFCSAPTIVPVIRVFPRFQVSVANTSFTIISPNYSNALVILDASLSTNSASAPMRFAWFNAGATNPFATNIVAKDLLELGSQTVQLEVFALNGAATSNATVQIITSGQAVGELEGRIEQAALGRQLSTLLANPLDSAQRAFDKGQPDVGLVHLRVFEARVTKHLAPNAPALAADFFQVAQEIINAVQPPASHAPGMLAVRPAGLRHGHLTFNGSPGQMYLLEASSNLSAWEIIGVANELNAGSFEFNDPGAGKFPNRFYRLALP